MVKQALILSGGFGKRAEKFSQGLPKSLLVIDEKPLIDYQLKEISKTKINKIHFLLGHKSERIIEYLNNSHWQKHFSISFSIESEPKGTGGALVNAEGALENEFLLICGDLMIDSVIKSFLENSEYFQNVILHRATEHIFDSNLLMLDFDNKVTDVLIKPHTNGLYLRNRAFTGVYKLSRHFVDYLKQTYGNSKFDLDSEGIKYVLPDKHVFYSISSPGFIRDIGTKDRFNEVTKMYKSGGFRARSKAVFLDRDGVVNLDDGYINHPDKIILSHGLIPFIKQVKELGFKVFVVTNQPILARGEIEFSELEIIHAKIDTILADHDTYIDEYFVCPHHPDKGFEGEITSLKIICSCRKPKPGMLIQAIEKYSVVIDESFMVGDREVDFLAARAIGLKYAHLSEGQVNLSLPIFHSFDEILQEFIGGLKL